MPDLLFAHPRLAQVYDPFEPDRADLDVYSAMVDELGARTVLDIGCGTGSFACLLAGRGIDVTAVDPAEASLSVAQGKPNAERVRWLHGDATSLPPLDVDAAFMTGNVAQVFLTDEEWLATLGGVRAALRTSGRFVFESRVPERRAWEGWTKEKTFARKAIPGVGFVEVYTHVIDVRGELVTFQTVFRFEADGEVLTSQSTIRFRERKAIEASLRASGFALDEVRDAPDRPGREFVFIASRL